MHTPATMSTFPSLVSRHASRGIRPQVLSMNIPLLLAPTKEIQRPGSTPPLRSRASSSTGYRPHFTEFFDQTELITVLPLFPLNTQIQSVQSNPSIPSVDQSILSGSLRSVHPSIPSVNQSTQIAHQPISHRSIYPNRPSTHHPNSNQSTQTAHQPIIQIHSIYPNRPSTHHPNSTNLPNSPINPSAKSSPSAHCSSIATSQSPSRFPRAYRRWR